MPVESQSQRRWAYATAAGKTDAPKAVGREFVDSSHGLKGLPEHASKSITKEIGRRLLKGG